MSGLSHVSVLCTAATSSVKGVQLKRQTGSETSSTQLHLQLFKMSEEILAAPVLNVNVRCTRESEENRGEEEEYQVTFDGILEDEEHHADLGSKKASKSEMINI